MNLYAVKCKEDSLDVFCIIQDNPPKRVPGSYRGNLPICGYLNRWMDLKKDIDFAKDIDCDFPLYINTNRII